MSTTRRQYILAAGVTITGAGAAASVSGQQDGSDLPELTFGEINHEGEYVVLHNEGSSDVDIDGLWMNWEYGQQEDQSDQFASQHGATSIPANGSITVATGYETQEDADVDFDRGAPVMNNDGSDTYAVETESRESTIARSDEDRHESSTPTETETSTETATETETSTETETPGDSETPTDTPTETETPTSTETPTETETPTDTEKEKEEEGC